MEGFDLPRATVDVVVTDGFTGNVALKVLEATVEGAHRARSATRVRSGPVSSARRPADPRQAAAACATSSTPRGWAARSCSGLRKPVVVAHGSFGPRGIANAVRLAQRAVDEDMVGRTAAALEAAGALRSAPAGSVVGATSESVERRLA